MIRDVTAFTIQCDECYKDFSEDSIYAIFVTAEDAELYAEDSDWHIEDGKHYCYDCWNTIQEELENTIGTETNV